MFIMDNPQTGLTIKIVAERTGVSVHTLRAWERRYGVPQPQRGAGNRYRLYDETDIANVLWMKRQIEAGLAPAQAGWLFQQHHPSRAVGIAESREPIVVTQAALMTALVNSDSSTAQKILDDAFALFAPDRVALEIIQPTLTEIGERWAHNELSVGQEHYASNLIRKKLFAVLQSQATPAAPTAQIVAACAPAEDHEIGLLVFALLAQRQNWRVAYLGQRTPLTDLANAARAKPAWIVVSVTTVIGLCSLIPLLAPENRPAAPLAFGGRLPDLVPALREHLPGVVLADDVVASVRAFATLTPRAKLWAPGKRAWDAVCALHAQRFALTAETVSKLMANVSTKHRRVLHPEELHAATLYLVDSLACALAFGAPTIIDLERAWLAQAMPPRAVSSELIARHIEIFARALERTLGEPARQFKPLIARLQDAAAMERKSV